MIRTFLAWLDHRTGIKGLLHEALFERIPGGARWRYVWGSTLVFTFMLQLITGVFLWTAYSPSAQTAWESVYYIQEVMFLGGIVRGIHHFAAQAMVVLLAFHLIQVIIDGAYKAPREVNFWLGLILMQIVLGLGLTGYLLPWDQKGYYATQVSTKIMGATPFVGQQLQELVQGGPEYGHHTLTRFFAMHAGILPGLLIFFLVLHLYVFRRHGITPKDRNYAPDTTFWPDQVLKDGVAMLGVLSVVLLLAIFKGAELSPPADSAEAYEAARPEWYFLFLFRFLKFEAIEHFGKLFGETGAIAFGAIYVPGVLFTVLAAMPLIARWRSGHKFNVAFTWLVAAGAAFLTGLAFYEDSHNDSHQMAIQEANRDAHRTRELAKGPTMIPVEGAVSLLRNDPFTQGPRLFAKHCASCHRIDGHNGRGRLVMASAPKRDSESQTSLEGQPESVNKTSVAAPEAADLGNFGSREWMKSILLSYSEHFAPLRNAQWYKDALTKKEKGEDVEFLNLDASEMADAAKAYAEVLNKPENAEDLNAVVEYLFAQTARPGVNQDLAKRGESLLSGAELKDGSTISQCTDCHDKFGQKFEPANVGNGYPDLAGYGSAEWLKAFIRSPGSEQFYSAKNRMPAYAEKLTDHELDLLVRWMTGNYYPTHVQNYPSRVAELPK